jgi:hypothetical protein
VKPYSGRLSYKRTRTRIRPPSAIKLPSLPDQFFKISTFAAATWSLSGFLFGVGFINRIDPSILQILTISDVFGVSISYAIVTIPLLAIMALWPWQFMIPVNFDRVDSNTKLDLLPFHILKMVAPYKVYLLLFLFAILPNLLWLFFVHYDLVDRTTLLYTLGDVILMPLTFVFTALLSPIRIGNAHFDKRLMGFLFILSLLISGSYVAGDYASSVRMNNPSRLDCAILTENKGRCTPILVWGSSYFITWHGNRMRSVPTNKVDHIWLHPNKEPDKPRRF